MSDLHLLSGAYALDALHDVERAGFERHLRTCESCLAEVTEFHEATASLAGRVAATPPEGLRARLLDEVSRTRQLAPATVHRRVPRPSLRRSLATAAAAVLIAGGAGLGGIAIEGRQAAQEAQAQAAAMAQVMTDPAKKLRDGTMTGGGTASVVTASGRAVFAAGQLPALSDGRVYQLWLVTPAGSIDSAGLLDVQDGSGQALVDGVKPGSSLAVSVEPAGGSQQPTTQPILNLALA